MCEVFERRFSLINSSHRYSTQPNYRSTPNYPTKTKARVPLSLFVALRLFSRADTRSGVHITCFSQKSKNVPLWNVLAKNVPLCVFSRILERLNRRSNCTLHNLLLKLLYNTHTHVLYIMGGNKTIRRCATTSFSPTSTLIACGTVAGAMDDSFSTTASLEVFSVDHSNASSFDSSSNTNECEMVGTGVSVTERFHRLCWGDQVSERLPAGILAGGLADGTVQLYDPNAMMIQKKQKKREENEENGASFFGANHEDLPSANSVSGCVLTTLQNAHAGAVRGLDFNPFSSNLLASGGRDGELSIWDINDPMKPSKYPALVSGPSGPHTGEIAQIQWNTKVSHILASCGTTSGTTVVWDLKRQRPVISFVDPQSKRRCSAISWNPDVATQLIVASDDDRSCSLQVWDLRNSVAPTNEFVGHTKGVLSLAWSPHDGDLLLSSGKDNRTLVWDAKDGSVLAEFPASSNWNFDAQWSKKTAGEISAASFDGTISIHNLNDCGKQSAHQHQHQQYGQNGTQQQQHQQQPREPMRKAPKWMKRPAGASFGFGGKLVSFGSDNPGVVKITTVDVSDEHESRSASAGARHGTSLAGVSDGGGDAAEENDIDAEFQAAIKSNDEQQLKALCDARSQSKDPSISSEDKETWAFMSILFSDDARRRMLEHLNFSDALKNLERSKQMRLTEAALENATLNDDTAGTSSSGLEEQSQMVAPPPPVEDENAFFDGLGEDVKNQSGLASPRKSTIPTPLSPKRETKQEKVAPVLKREPADREIERCLIVGDYDGAVESCEKAGRFADALVLASSAGPELWQRAQKRHLERSPRRYLHFAESIASANLEKLVESEPITNWRETLAILCTYSDAKAWDDLSLNLAEKLQAANMPHEASLCRVCAGDVDNAVKHWSMRARGSATSSKFTSKKAQWQLLEKAIVLSRAANLSQATPGFARLLSSRAESLASSGKLKSALALLDMAPGAGINGREDADIALLRERIDRASSESKAASSTSAGGYHQQPRSNGYSRQPPPMQPSSYGGGGGVPPMNPMMNTSFAAPPPPQQQQQPFQPPPSYSAAPPPPPTQFTPPPAPAQMSAPAMPPPPTNPDASFYGAPPPVPASAHLPPQGSANTSFYAPPSVPGAPGGSTNSYDPYGGGGRRESEVPKPPPVTSFAPSEMEYDDAPVQSAYSTGASAPQHGGGGMNQSFQQMTPPAPGMGQQSMMPPPPKQMPPPPSYAAGPPPPMQQQQQQQSYAPPPPMASQPPPMQQQMQVPPPISQPPAAPTPSFDPSPVMDAPPAPSVSPRSRGGPAGGGPPPAAAAPPSYSPAAAPPPSYSPAPSAAPPPMQQQQSFQQASPQQQFQHQAPPPMQQQQQQPPQHHQALSPPQQQQQQQHQQQPPSPRRPAGPPADVTLSTVQSSNCSPSGAQISQCVKKMHDECFQQLASNPVRKKELEDCSKRLGQLCWRLNEKQVSAAVEEKLMKLCDAASRGDWATANSVHVEMTTQHWDECSGFLTALKRLLKTRSAL